MLAMWLNSNCYPAHSSFFFFCCYLFLIDIYITQICRVIILIHIKSSSFVWFFSLSAHNTHKKQESPNPVTCLQSVHSVGGLGMRRGDGTGTCLASICPLLLGCEFSLCRVSIWQTEAKLCVYWQLGQSLLGRARFAVTKKNWPMEVTSLQQMQLQADSHALVCVV